MQETFFNRQARVVDSTADFFGGPQVQVPSADTTFFVVQRDGQPVVQRDGQQVVNQR